MIRQTLIKSHQGSYLAFHLSLGHLALKNYSIQGPGMEKNEGKNSAPIIYSKMYL